MISTFLLLIFMKKTSSMIDVIMPSRNTESNANNLRWQESKGDNEEFGELNLIEEGEPRYGLVQVSKHMP